MSTQPLKPGWKMVKFGDIVKNANLVGRDPETYGIDRIVGLEHIDSENLHIRRWNSIEDGTSFSRRFVPGQTLFGKRRAYQRKVAYAEFEGICSGDILTFESKNKKVFLPELLPFICQSDAFFNHALDTSAGSLSPRTSWKALNDFLFPLPPLYEQKRLAEILWAADESVETFNTLLSEHKKAVAVLRGHLFEDIPGEVTTLGQMVKKDELDIQTGPFGTVLSASSYVASGTPILNPIHMKGDGILDTESGPFISDDDVTRLSRYKVLTGDILLSRKGEMGRVSIIDEDLEGCLVGSDCMRFRFLSERVLPQFVYEYWQGPKQQSWFERFASGTTMLGLNEPSLHLMPIHIPTLDVQVNLIDKFQKLRQKKKEIQRHLLIQQELRKSLLSSFLEGSVHV